MLTAPPSFSYLTLSDGSPSENWSPELFIQSGIAFQQPGTRRTDPHPLTKCEEAFAEPFQQHALGGVAYFGASYLVGGEKYVGPEIVFCHWSRAKGLFAARQAREDAERMATAALPLILDVAATFGGEASMSVDFAGHGAHVVRVMVPVGNLVENVKPSQWRKAWRKLFADAARLAA